MSVGIAQQQVAEALGAQNGKESSPGMPTILFPQSPCRRANLFSSRRSDSTDSLVYGILRSSLSYRGALLALWEVLQVPLMRHAVRGLYHQPSSQPEPAEVALHVEASVA